MDQFNTIDKNEGMCCVETQTLAVVSITKPNFANVLNDNCSKKKYFVQLCNWSVDSNGVP
jgi:hypothetical protein